MSFWQLESKQASVPSPTIIKFSFSTEDTSSKDGHIPEYEEEDEGQQTHSARSGETGANNEEASGTLHNIKINNLQSNNATDICALNDDLLKSLVQPNTLWMMSILDVTLFFLVINS